MPNSVKPKPIHPKHYKVAECFLPILGLIPISRKIDRHFHLKLTHMSQDIADSIEKGHGREEIALKTTLLQNVKNKKLELKNLCMKLAIYRNLPITLRTQALPTLLILGKIGVALAFICTYAMPLAGTVILFVGAYAVIGILLEQTLINNYKKKHHIPTANNQNKIPNPAPNKITTSQNSDKPLTTGEFIIRNTPADAEYLDLSKLKVDETELRKIITHCPNLTTLNLSDSRGISSICTKYLLELKKLENLDLTNCILFPLEDVDTLKDQLPYLKTVITTGCGAKFTP